MKNELRLKNGAESWGWIHLSGLLALLCTGLLIVVVSGCGKDGSSHAGHAGTSEKTAKYYCPMHPTYVSDRPGDCPICNMRLVPLKDKAAGNASASPNLGTSSVPGRITIAISPEKRQTIGLATSAVEMRNFAQTLRITGTVVHDERRLARVAPRFGGWVRALQVNYTGQAVTKGQPLFTVYSPELFTAENEYLLTVRNFQILTNIPAGQRDSARRLMESARRRLQLLEVGEEEIKSLEQREQASDELQIRAPFSGHVIAKSAVEGKSFTAGEALYEIADLSHLWVRAYVYEYELPAITVGQKARVVFPYLDNRTLETSVSFIYPHIDPQTRRAEVRVELDNPNHLLRPDMWANVEIEHDLGQVLAVPASAVIDTGTRFVAFVDGPQDHLQPREVKIGARLEDYLQILEGLKAGEKVVTRALFLVDSESQLKAAIAGMGAEAKHEH
jgi:RND family efflux transporter MFP subunit